MEEKLNPWMQPIFDNVEFLMNLSRADKKAGRGYHELIDLGLMEIEPLTYIRGRSIPNQYIIVDEAQNLTPHEVKTIITRVGDDTKIVLTGDPFQIDNPYVDATNNGLVHVVNRFKNEKIAGHITMAKGERSALAELAANLLLGPCAARGSSHEADGTGRRCHPGRAAVTARRRSRSSSTPPSTPSRSWGGRSAGFREYVRDLFRRLMGTEISPDSIREQPSSKGKYLSVSVSVYLLSEEHRRSIYARLHRSSGSSTTCESARRARRSMLQGELATPGRAV